MFAVHFLSYVNSKLPFHIRILKFPLLYPIMCHSSLHPSVVLFFTQYSIGEATWVRVIEHYIRRKGIHDYRLAHDGKPPPDPFHIAFLKKITPFLFKSDRAERRENFAIGLEMQARMREKMTRGKQSDEMIRAK